MIMHRWTRYLLWPLVSIVLILKVSPSSSTLELKTGREITLHCELQSQIFCDGISPGIFSWVNETGTPLEGDRYKLNQSRCASTLTVTLQHSDQNRKWTCQLTREGEVKASYSYTTILSDSLRSLLPVWIGLGVAAAVCVAVFVIIVGIVVCRRRTESNIYQVPSVTNRNTGQNEDAVTYATVNHSTGGQRKPKKATADTNTEYASIKTSG
ncbi:hypothetical protein MATL_G00164180 [Megalops atlanticus]|uniref:Ig-like domain-containing protein n=1 Tax=Megalops atlanticus TaxID=7932 RepID=A0A9D3PVD8_MEGAT|nr:hypothetical protein MATL_G00164180 [Megalops atlanticus]